MQPRKPKQQTKPPVKKRTPAKKREPKKTVEELEFERRGDWERLDAEISNAFCYYLISNSKLPSYAEIARTVKCNELSVRRHMKEGKFMEFVQKFRAGNERVMLNLFKQAATGQNERMIRLWFEVVENLGNEKKIDITTKGEKLPENSTSMVTKVIFENYAGD